MKPNVSVVLTVFNGDKHIQEALESILNQSFKQFEVVVINDGSTYKTQEIVTR
jgi:glycosyltransferase involved in cell wall biosynthesis